METIRKDAPALFQEDVRKGSFIDIKGAYFHMRWSEESRGLQGFQFEKKIYISRSTNFGTLIAPSWFNRLTRPVVALPRWVDISTLSSYG